MHKPHMLNYLSDTGNSNNNTAERMKYNLKNRRCSATQHRGFTIVELLIVIVVIAILASISVAAYSGVNTSANRQSASAELHTWEKLFLAYKAIYGTFPLMVYRVAAIASGLDSRMAIVDKMEVYHHIHMRKILPELPR